VDSFRTLATLVTIGPIVPRAASHTHDDLILATAVAGSADYLVTGDREPRALGSYEGIAILTPREFLDVLDALDSAPDEP
jgi:predicted nucleic acid-binding protein